MNRYRITLAALGACCAFSLYLFTAGKSEEQIVAAPTTPKMEKKSNLAADNRLAKSETNSTSASAEKSADKAQGSELEPLIEEQTLVFEPPFPGHMNLFQAPKRQGRGGIAKSGGQSETAVELLGFVNVNGQRVALSIDGLVTTIAEGDQAYGIEVLSIQPPSVFLQRGKQRWQASFEN